jgi:hypothetical protein
MVERGFSKEKRRDDVSEEKIGSITAEKLVFREKSIETYKIYILCVLERGSERVHLPDLEIRLSVLERLSRGVESFPQRMDALSLFAFDPPCTPVDDIFFNELRHAGRRVLREIPSCGLN